MKPQLQKAIESLRLGGIISYPTESVFGLGVDPDNIQAISQLLVLKSRPQDKGLILVAATWQQLSEYVDFNALPVQKLKQVLESWPGPTTWLIPIKGSHPYLSGTFNTLAVRVSAHSTVQQLCEGYGKPIVSTSANRAGQTPAINAAEVEAIFGDELACIVEGLVGSLSQPTQILDALSGKRLR